MFESMQTLIIFPVKVFIFRYKSMMDNTPAKKYRKSPKNRQKSIEKNSTFVNLLSISLGNS